MWEHKVVGSSSKSRSSPKSSTHQPESRGVRGARPDRQLKRGAALDRKKTLPANATNAQQSRWRRRHGQNEEPVFDWKVYDKKFWNQYWVRYSGVAHPNKMPLSGGTRMLRARRKDINVKPNRRLDRKSSKGMLFENEELRMRTIAINSEVEQGQHALKKLRRENELLRREVWNLRDEYAKMENMIQKKDSDGEETDDQENSYSGEESDAEDEEDEENLENGEGDEEQPSPEDADQENVENQNKSTLLVPRRSSRAFDGLSVIEEQTEETATTEQSRGSSVARPFFAEAESSYYPVYTLLDPRKQRCEWGYRPASPYPYAKASPIPPYDQRMQLLQEPRVPPLPERSEGNLWMYPEGTQSLPRNASWRSNDELRFQENGRFQAPSMENGMYMASEGAFQMENGRYITPDGSIYTTFQAPLSINIPRYTGDPPLGSSERGTAGSSGAFEEDYSLGLVQERHGPDVFITDNYSYMPLPPLPNDLNQITSDMNKMEISKTDEGNSNVLSGQTQDAAAAVVSEACEGTTAKNGPQQKQVDETAVGCQFSANQDEDAMRRSPLDKKPFQSKLTLTLRFPENGRKSPGRSTAPNGAKSNRCPPPTTPPNGGKSNRCPPTTTPAVSSLKHEKPRLQTFSVHPRTGTGSVVVPVSSLPPRTIDIPEPEAKPLTPLPRPLGSSASLDGVPAGKTGQNSGQAKPKVAPAPPPRTSSCPAVSAGIVPTLPIGVTALHHRAFRKGKSASVSSHQESDREPCSEPPPSHHSSANPLLMSEPAATSSPTLPPKFVAQKSTESHKTTRLRKQSSIRSTTQDETTDDGIIVTASNPLVRKSSKASKAEVDRLSRERKLRKQSQVSISSIENSLLDKNPSRLIGLNNISISSSSGLDSPTKNDRQKRRVSIKFNKRSSSRMLDEERPGILHSKSRYDDMDGTISDRERTNSVSSRTSSVLRRKLSTSSSKTVFHEEKIPWCGCWGNGCL